MKDVHNIKSRKELLALIPNYVAIPPFMTAEELRQVIINQSCDPKTQWSTHIEEVLLGKRTNNNYWDESFYNQIFDSEDTN